MTDEELDAIEARANVATPGPWAWDQHGDLRSTTATDPDWWDSETTAPFVTVIVTDTGAYPPRGATAEFIAAARTDVPTLVAEVRRLRALLKMSDATGQLARGW